MMDHILDQAPSLPASRPRTPSGASISSQRASFSSNAGMRFTDVIEEGGGLLTERERRGSQVSDVINPLTGLPGALSRRPSAGAGSNSALSPTTTQTLYQRDTANNNNNNNNSSTMHPTSRRGPPRNHSEPVSTVPPPVLLPTAHSTTSIPGPAPPAQRTLQSADQLNARLPPQLLAFRMAGMGGAANASASANVSNPPISSPMTNTSSFVIEKERKDESSSSTNTNGGAGGAARRMSLLAMTPKDEKEETKLYEKRASAGEGMYGPPPILVNPKCSGYFVEPVRLLS